MDQLFCGERVQSRHGAAACTGPAGGGAGGGAADTTMPSMLRGGPPTCQQAQADNTQKLSHDKDGVTHQLMPQHSSICGYPELRVEHGGRHAVIADDLLKGPGRSHVGMTATDGGFCSAAGHQADSGDGNEHDDPATN